MRDSLRFLGDLQSQTLLLKRVAWMIFTLLSKCDRVEVGLCFHDGARLFCGTWERCYMQILIISTVVHMPLYS